MRNYWLRVIRFHKERPRPCFRNEKRDLMECWKLETVFSAKDRRETIWVFGPWRENSKKPKSWWKHRENWQNLTYIKCIQNTNSYILSLLRYILHKPIFCFSSPRTFNHFLSNSKFLKISSVAVWSSVGSQRVWV